MQHVTISLHAVWTLSAVFRRTRGAADPGAGAVARSSAACTTTSSQATNSLERRTTTRPRAANTRWDSKERTTVVAGARRIAASGGNVVSLPYNSKQVSADVKSKKIEIVVTPIAGQ